MSDQWRPVGENAHYGRRAPGPGDRYVPEEGPESADTGYSDPGYAEPAYQDSGYSGYSDSGYSDAGYADAGYADAEYEDREYRDGYGESADYADPPEYADRPPYTDRPRYDDETQVIRAIPAEVGVASHGSRAQARRRRQASDRRRRRGKWVGSLAAVMVLVVLGGLLFVGGKVFFGADDPPADYAGPGGEPVVVEVSPGDTAEQIARSMADKDVVASSNAFYRAALLDEGMNTVQPGFYSIPSRIPAAQAVSALVAPGARVGHMVISEGRQLHDSRDVQTEAVKKGIYTLIAEASCIGAEGAQQCIEYDELNTAGAGDLADLGVPDWAADAVANVPDRDRQLEGLIAAGSWDFDPTADPTAILRKLVTESAAAYEETGIRTAGGHVGMTPYEVLISASLVEREAKPDDFAKVARVIVNRLAIGQPLQFDSTVNYSLDTTELATTDADRAEVTPWNTYASPGLPATPIASPSIAALQAAEAPEQGDWTYFVTIDQAGTTLFSNSYDEHLSNTRHALQSGILDSGR
ncbi:UPF0755 protein [Rhodococcus triatomae]|uniref:Endolytic murein transglycosylase n=1 Tax=Rhodococcus triatomae TaxID=300028 RepID=A0A1G8KHE7_9NOCA|nr:endolytic transglycosylase MltG [Rhodococcus triatomae]SDI42839.1 UPF0755 protein [Rhodococcus triatomae]